MIPPPPRKILRRMGFLRDQRGIIDRYVRESDAWQDHLRRSREILLRCMRDTRQSHLTVLGSGWWLDLPPVEELSSLFSKIFLVDIVHPREIIHRAGKYPAVHLVEADLTGGLVEQMYEQVRSRKKKEPSLEHLVPRPFQPDFEPGFVVSLNILTQLDSLLLEYRMRYIRCEEAACEAFRQRVQKEHLRALPPSGACLISDVEEIRQRKGKTLHERKTLLTPVPDRYLRDRWEWRLDTQGTYYPGEEVSLRVHAWCW